MSIAGALVCPLLEWRNPQGREDNWDLRRLERGTGQIVKDVVAVVALNVLAIVALVEAAVYGIFYSISTLFSSSERENCLRTASVTLGSLACSSLVTMVWAMFSSFLIRVSDGNTPTQEGTFRFFADAIIGTALRGADVDVNFVREEDRNLTRNLFGQHATDDQLHDLLNLFAYVSPLDRVPQDIVDQGADFLIKEVLGGLDEKTVQKFKDMDYEMISFITTRAVFEYAAGSKRGQPIPDFFKDPGAIQALREQFRRNPGANQEIQAEKLYSLENFSGQLIEEEAEELENLEEKKQNPARVAELKAKQARLEAIAISSQNKEVYQQLTKIGSEEIQGSVLVTRCWQKAIGRLSP